MRCYEILWDIVRVSVCASNQASFQIKLGKLKKTLRHFWSNLEKLPRPSASCKASESNGEQMILMKDREKIMKDFNHTGDTFIDLHCASHSRACDLSIFKHIQLRGRAILNSAFPWRGPDEKHEETRIPLTWQSDMSSKRGCAKRHPQFHNNLCNLYQL